MSVSCWRIPTSEEEIVDIYFEEVGELVENINHHLNVWKQNPTDKKTLTEIRRAFHTLKGSGRMANVLDLSELAWKIENMLNQAIAGAVPVSRPMVNLVAAVQAEIPRIVNALKEGRSVREDGGIVKLMGLADTLASKKKSAQFSATLATADTGAKQYPELHNINLKLEKCMQRADEALRRSEIALQQARQISASTEDTKPAIGRRIDAQMEPRGFGWPALILSALFGAVTATVLLIYTPVLG